MNFKPLCTAACLLVSLGLLTLPGCGSGRKDFTPESFATIQEDMPEAKVIEILGKPSETIENGGVRRLFWATKGKYYSISFHEGKVNEPLAHGSQEDYQMMIALMKMPLGDGFKEAKKPSTQPAAMSASLPKIEPRAKLKLPAQNYREPTDVYLFADGKRVAVEGRESDKTFTQIWDLSGQPKVVAQFEGYRFSLSPSGKRILVTSDLQPKVYDVESKKELAKLPGSYSFGFFRDENTVVTTSRSHMFADHTPGRIDLWDVSKNAAAGSFEIPDNRFHVAFIANNGKELWLFMAHEKFEVECYDLDTKMLARVIKPEPSEPGKPYKGDGLWPTVAADSSVLASYVDNPLRFFDATSGKILASLPPDLGPSPSGILPGGTRYVARPDDKPAKKLGLKEGDVVLYDWKQGKALAALTGHSPGQFEGGKTPVVVASSDGNTALSVTDSGECLVYDISKAK